MAQRTPDAVSADFSSFNARSPRWMSRTYHLFRIAGVLNDQVGIGAGLVSDLWPSAWLLIQPPADYIGRLLRWEAAFGRETERFAYNQRGLDRARQTLEPVLSSFRGLHDCFVPVVERGRAEVVLVSGSFRTEAVSAEAILEQWQVLSGKPTDAHDPELGSYARAALGAPLFGPRQVRAFVELLQILARALVAEVSPPRELERVAHLRERVFGRLPRSRQARAAAMLDPSFGQHVRDFPVEPWQAAEVGIRQVPNAVLAVAPTAGSNAVGVVPALIAGHTFQARCAALSERSGDTLVAPLGSNAAYFLFHVPAHESALRRRQSMLERARKLGELVARHVGEPVVVGVGGLGGGDVHLPECGRRAAIALELALHQHQPLLDYEDVQGQSRGSAFSDAPSSQLSRLVEVYESGRLGALDTRRAAFVRSVLVDSAGRSEIARVHFETAIDAVLGVLRAHRSVDARTLVLVRERYRAELARSTSAAEQAAVLHDALEALADLERRPAGAELELKLGRAARLIEAHAAEQLSLGAVARRVGLSPNYFSTEFKRAFGTGFSQHLVKTRVATAQRLLRASTLGISRVGEEAGFATTPHFNRVFKQHVGLTPSAYRARKR